MTPKAVPPAYGRKPVKEEPFRYVCPDCRHQVNGIAHSFSYQCGTCRRTWPFEKLYDKKRGMIVGDADTY